MPDIDTIGAQCATEIAPRDDGSDTCEHIREEHSGRENLGPCEFCDDCDKFTVDELADDD